MTPAKPEKAAAELWSASVPPEVLAVCSKKEIQRQETIYEIIATEKEFVKDLENTIRVCMLLLGLWLMNFIKVFS